MADLKHRTLRLTSGKQIRLFGYSVAISKTLEIGEGFAPNILSQIEDNQDNKTSVGVANPHKLTMDDLMELADYNIQLWMNLKAALRQFGGIDPKIFGQDSTKSGTPSQEKPTGLQKQKKADEESQTK